MRIKHLNLVLFGTPRPLLPSIPEVGRQVFGKAERPASHVAAKPALGLLRQIIFSQKDVKSQAIFEYIIALRAIHPTP